MKTPDHSKEFPIHIFEARPGSLECFEDVTEVTMQMRRLLAPGGVVILPKGTISDTFNLVDLHCRHVPSDGVPGAIPHTHQTQICLVAAPGTVTPTLIFDPVEVAKRITELVSMTKWRTTLQKIFGNDPDMAKKFDSVLEDLRQLHIAGNNQTIHEQSSPLNALQALFDSVDDPGSQAEALQFIAAVQEAQDKTVQEIRWSVADAIVFLACHGRDVRTKSNRDQEGGLYVLPLRPR